MTFPADKGGGSGGGATVSKMGCDQPGKIFLFVATILTDTAQHILFKDKQRSTDRFVFLYSF